METNLEIDALIQAIISIRVNAPKYSYGPTVDAVKRLNIEMSHGLLASKEMRKPVLSCILGKRVVSTKFLSAGEVNYINNAIIKHIIPGHTLQCLELALGGWCWISTHKPEDFLMWSEDRTKLDDAHLRIYWPIEFPLEVN